MYSALTSKRDYLVILFNGEKVNGRKLLGADLIQIINYRWAGQFAVPRWIEREEEGARELRYQLVSNLYLVFRQAVEKMARYGFIFLPGEKEKMAGIVQAAKACNLAIISQPGENPEAYSRVLLEKRAEILLLLGRAKNPVKLEALIKAGELGTIFDSQDRVNLPAKRSLALAIGNRATERQRQIDFIVAKIVPQLWAAGTALDWAESSLESAMAAIKDLGWYLRNHPKLTRQEKEWVVTRLVQETKALGQVNFQPFYVNFRLSGAEIEQACRCLREGDNKKALDYLRRVYFSLRYKKVQSEVEDIILRMSLMLLSKKKLSGESLAESISKIRDKVAKINEAGFSRRVKNKVLPEFTAAIEALEKGEINIAKEALKAASEAMTWYL
ncbi:MAG: hypothetical protein ABIH38_05250 [Patescibacteria group bacterium]